MSVIAKDNYVALEYRLWLDSGEQLRGAPEAPAVLTFVAGCNELMPGLERRLIGLREQEAVEFTVPAAEAFGDYEITYTLVDGRLLKVSKAVAAKINELDLQPGETFGMCKQMVFNEQRKRLTPSWTVWSRNECPV